MDHPVAPEETKVKKMPTTMSVDMEEISGLSDADVGDKLDLKVSVKVTGINRDTYEDTDTTRITLEIVKIEFSDRTVNKEAEGEEKE